MPATYQCFTIRAFRFLGNMPNAKMPSRMLSFSAYKHLGQFGGVSTFTWLTTIVTNAALMKLRRRDNYLLLDEEHGDKVPHSRTVT